MLQARLTADQRTLRTYDLIIRLAGDEFLCAMSTGTLSDARERFGEVAAVLASSSHRARSAPASPNCGATTPPRELIARADGQLIGTR